MLRRHSDQSLATHVPPRRPVRRILIGMSYQYILTCQTMRMTVVTVVGYILSKAIPSSVLWHSRLPPWRL